MKLLDTSGKLFGRFNIIDVSMLAFLLLVAAGIVAVQSGWHQTSGEQIQGETDIQYTVALRDVKVMNPESLFTPGRKVSMTIRNQPRGEVEVLEAVYAPKKAIVPAGGSYNVIDDPKDPHIYDFRVTLKDHALVGREGYVTNGVKVKIGMHMVVEGFDFQIPGHIADVRALGQE